MARSPLMNEYRSAFPGHGANGGLGNNIEITHVRLAFSYTKFL